ncbi:MAG TPA: hypothetical protein ENH94_03455 [Phycisphaerales bacterium]|nr:hypothetical protein [Phycisphaerales bacterium]
MDNNTGLSLRIYNMSKLILGPKLTFDPKTEKFVGADSAEANKLLRYEMRKEFAIQQISI